MKQFENFALVVYFLRQMTVSAIRTIVVTPFIIAHERIKVKRWTDTFSHFIVSQVVHTQLPETRRCLYSVFLLRKRNRKFKHKKSSSYEINVK